MYNISKPLEADCSIVALGPALLFSRGRSVPGPSGSLCRFLSASLTLLPLFSFKCSSAGQNLASLHTNHPGPAAGPRGPPQILLQGLAEGHVPESLQVIKDLQTLGEGRCPLPVSGQLCRWC